MIKPPLKQNGMNESSTSGQKTKRNHSVVHLHALTPTKAKNGLLAGPLWPAQIHRIPWHQNALGFRLKVFLRLTLPRRPFLLSSSYSLLSSALLPFSPILISVRRQNCNTIESALLQFTTPLHQQPTTPFLLRPRPPPTEKAVKMAAQVPAQGKKGEHLDLNGNVFELPHFTMKEIHDAIPAHCFKPSILRSMAYVVRDFFYYSVLIYAATTYIPMIPSAPLRALAWAAYTTVAGFVFTGIWILAHECGHGAFSKNKKLNWTMGLIMHSFLLVPFHSWRLSHSQHHKATGNMDKDTAFVPHSRQSWLDTKFGSKAKENMVEFAELAEDSPIAVLIHCIIHQLFGWPGYLLFNLTGQKYDGASGAKISHFYFGEDSVFFKQGELSLIVLSDVAVAVMIAGLVWAGQVFGSWNVIILWGVPWLWVNNWIGKSFSSSFARFS